MLFPLFSANFIFLSSIESMSRLWRNILLLISTRTMFFGFLERYYLATIERRFSGVDPAGMIKLRSLLIPKTDKIQCALKRFGSENDGGYLLFKDIRLSTDLLSFGIGDNLDFEKEMAPFVNRILAFDGSIDKLPSDVLGLEFRNKYVGDITSINTVCITDIIPEMKSDYLILKIDIEGAEWRVLNQLSDTHLERFDQIVGEFHGLSSLKSNQEIMERIHILERLHAKFTLINSHPNNWSPYRIVKGVPVPDAVELTFLKNELFSNFFDPGLATEVLQLNKPCNPLKPEHII